MGAVSFSHSHFHHCKHIYSHNRRRKFLIPISPNFNLLSKKKIIINTIYRKKMFFAVTFSCFYPILFVTEIFFSFFSALSIRYFQFLFYLSFFSSKFSLLCTQYSSSFDDTQYGSLDKTHTQY